MGFGRSYVSSSAASPLSGQTIGDHLASVISRQPDAEALVSRHQGARLTYGELGREVERVARGLLGLGIEKGDRVGIWSPTRVEWTLLQFATARVGAASGSPNIRTSRPTWRWWRRWKLIATRAQSASPTPLRRPMPAMPMARPLEVLVSSTPLLRHQRLHHGKVRSWAASRFEPCSPSERHYRRRRLVASRRATCESPRKSSRPGRRTAVVQVARK